MVREEIMGADPRPDLVEDSPLWTAVLQEALKEPLPYRRLYWPLQGIRCMGARLKPTPKGALKLVPNPPQYPEAEFRADCETYLRPYLQHVKAILGRAAQVLDEAA